MKDYMGIALLCLALGCGEKDDQGSGDDNAEDKCEKFLEVACDKVASCQIELGEIEATERNAVASKCQAGFAEQGLDCMGATGVTSAFEQCLQELDSTPCEELSVAQDNTPELPSACAAE